VQLEVTAAMRDLLARGERFALATMVDAHGSTPQRVGARLLVSEGGAMTGTLGGGCIEAEVVSVAGAAIADGRPAVLDFTLNEDIAVDYGLACGGSERILVDPTYGPADLPLVEQLAQAAAGEHRCVVVSIVDAPEPAMVARRIAVWEDGRVDGNLGAQHETAVEAARRLIAAPRPKSSLISLGDDVRAYADVFAEPPEVVIVGGGHVGRAVANVAHTLGYRMTVIDDRADFANATRFPDAQTIIAGDIERSIDAHTMTRNSAVIIVTRGHKYDYQALAAAARSDAGYIGLMGSRRKVTLIFRQLIDDGVPPERLRDIHAPIGLDIGAVSPEEIAVSIMAEITMHRLGGNGGTMRDERLIRQAQRTPTPSA
jgi:xanthine dehydrogenase accessory factor